MTDNQENESPTMRGVLGLANLGNTCYMNSALQALRHCPEWTLFLSKNTADSHVQDKNASTSKILYAYKDLLRSLWAGSGPGYVRPLGFFHELQTVVRGTLYDDFIQRTPQDAHEFMVWLLDQMYMATQKQVELPIRSLRKETEQQKALHAWKNAFESQYSPLTDLIFGLLRITLTCQNCQHEQLRWETFNVLKVGVRRDESLLSCLEAELADETIEDYRCDHCKETAPQTKTVRLWKLPKVLIVTLKRFLPTGGKDMTPLSYGNEALVFDSLFAEQSAEPSQYKSYTCFATVDHHGGSMGGGHYTAQCLSPVWRTWHVYDDESAHPIEQPSFGTQTYLMLFRQSSPMRAAAA